MAPSLISSSLSVRITLLTTMILPLYACGGGAGSYRGGAMDVGERSGTVNARLLLSEDFESGGFGSVWNDPIVRAEYYPPPLRPFTQFPGRGMVMHYYVPAGVDEITPVQAGLNGTEAFTAVTDAAEVDEFYIEWEEYFPSGHDFADGSQKLARFTRVEDSEEPHSGPHVDFWAQNDNTNIQLFFYHPNGNRGRAIDVFYNTNRAIPTGRWVKFGVWCRLNTPGRSDGFGRVFMDDELLIDFSGISNRGSSNIGWNAMWIGGNYTNQKPSTKATSRYLDNIRWFDTFPGG